MAPPKMYTKTSMMPTGMTTALSSASTLRLLSRRQRATIVATWRASGGGAGNTSSDTGLLLLGSGVLGSGVLGSGVLGSGGAPAGQGEKHVVEGRRVDREPDHRVPARVDLVEQRADRGGAGIRGDAEDE